MTDSKPVVRRAYGSGRWFPGGHAALVSAVEGYMDNAEVPPIEGRIVGGIVPHAGYVYSGAVAGHTFRALRDQAEAGTKPETVVVLGFLHRGGFPGVALLDGDVVETPVGKTALDRRATDRLAAASPRIQLDHRPHAGEHSAENLIPFVQVALPEAKLVVGLMGDHEDATREALADALAALASDTDIVVLASTDLLHDPSYERVSQTDKKTLAMIAALDEAGLKTAWSFSEQICCGISPVLTLIQFAKTQGVPSGVQLAYRNTGDDHPESRGRWVVGYGAVVFARPE